MSSHGTASRYVQGCRCEPCRFAWREYHREYRARGMGPEVAGRMLKKVGTDFPALGALALAGLAANA